MRDVREGYACSDARWLVTASGPIRRASPDDPPAAAGLMGVPVEPCVVVLGASVEDVKAGLAALRILRAADEHDAYAGILRNPSRGERNEWNVWFDGFSAYHGRDVDAAVLALAAMVEEGRDA